MKIAVASEKGMVTGHFGHCENFMVFNAEDNKIVGIDADFAQIDAAVACGAPTIEIHTGAYADAETDEQQQAELTRIIKGAEYAAAKGLVVNAGHGLNLNNVAAIAAIPQINELNIGHSIIADSVFVGLAQAVKDMKAAIQAAAR